MNHLPFEINSAIIESLQELDTAPEAFALQTETSVNGRIGWLTYTPESKQDICNVRLASHRLYTSSLSIFGALLGNRTFRLTQVGIEDLQAISSAHLLRPHILVLTFGSATFHDPNGNSFIKVFLDSFADPITRTRLTNGYKAAFQWIRSNSPFQMLSDTLRLFPNLHSLRILDNDTCGVDRHLGGWMNSNDVELVREVFDESRCKAFMEIMDEVGLDIDAPGVGLDMYTHSLENLKTIFSMVNSTSGFQLQDLRIDHRHVHQALGELYIPRVHKTLFSQIMHHSSDFHRLRKLRLQVTLGFVGHNGYDWWTQTCWTRTLTLLPNITHLFLYVEPSRYGWDGDYSTATRTLLQHLKSKKHLESLTLHGGWDFNIDDLTNFVAAHSSQKLKRLVLRNPTLSGSHWSLALTQLIQIQRICIEFFQIHEPMELDMQPYIENEDSPIARLPIFSTVDLEVITKNTSFVLDLRLKGGRNYILRPLS